MYTTRGGYGGPPLHACHRKLANRTEKIAEASGVGLLGFCQRLKPVGYLGEAFFTRGLCHTRIHIRVLVGFSVNGGFEIQFGIAEGLVSRGVAYLFEVVEMPVRVPSGYPSTSATFAK